MDEKDEFLKCLQKKKAVYFTYKTPQKRMFFHVKRSDRFKYLKDRILKNKKYFQNLFETDFKPVNFQSDKLFLIYGTIIILNENEAYIYNNSDESNCTPVKLNLDLCLRYSIFNGQLVVLRGKNIGNEELIVQEIHCLIPPCTDKAIHFLDCSITIVQNLHNIAEFSNDLVIFIGCYPTQNEFRKKNSTVNYLHVPTMEDIDCVEIYPMNCKKIDKQDCIALNNPCEFKLDDNVFYINTMPVIDILNEQEILKNKDKPKNDVCGNLLFSNDTITRLCHHLLFQRSYIPVLNVKNVCYDECLTMLDLPDFYIIRSNKFEPFCRDIGPTKVLNIGTNYNWNIKISGKKTKMTLIT